MPTLKYGLALLTALPVSWAAALERTDCSWVEATMPPIAATKAPDAASTTSCDRSVTWLHAGVPISTTVCNYFPVETVTVVQSSAAGSYVCGGSSSMSNAATTSKSPASAISSNSTTSLASSSLLPLNPTTTVITKANSSSIWPTGVVTNTTTSGNSTQVISVVSIPTAHGPEQVKTSLTANSVLSVSTSFFGSPVTSMAHPSLYNSTTRARTSTKVASKDHSASGIVSTLLHGTSHSKHATLSALRNSTCTTISTSCTETELQSQMPTITALTSHTVTVMAFKTVTVSDLPEPFSKVTSTYCLKHGRTFECPDPTATPSKFPSESPRSTTTLPIIVTTDMTIDLAPSSTVNNSH